jgi:hypothetical protein
LVRESANAHFTVAKGFEEVLDINEFGVRVPDTLDTIKYLPNIGDSDSIAANIDANLDYRVVTYHSPL